ITIENLSEGDYTVTVKGNKLSGSEQTFYIAYQFDSADYFNWHYPLKEQNVVQGEHNIIRWESGYAQNKGKLEYSLNETDWFLISDDVDLSKGFYEWQAPDTI